MKLHYTLFGSPRKADNSTQSASAPFSDQWGARFPDPHVSSLLTCHYDRHLSNDRHLLSNISFHVKGLQTFINNLFSEVRHQAYFSVSQVSFRSSVALWIQPCPKCHETCQNVISGNQFVACKKRCIPQTWSGFPFR